MISWWQHIPGHLDPIALAVGSFSLRWYAVFFFVGWVAAYEFSLYRFRNGGSPFGRDTLESLFLFAFAGALLGGRIGYALLYDPMLFSDPIRIVSPYGTDGSWTGISGMSLFGGVAGCVVAIFVFARRKNMRVLEIADFLAPIAPIALFFGRIGNFFNLELYGRSTDAFWGMYFPGVEYLRHPSQLYEAFFEGIVLFFLLLWIRKKRVSDGLISLDFLFFYGIFRFFLEFFREPDQGIPILFGWMTRGQLFSLVAILFGMVGWFWLSRRRNDILVNNKEE